MKQEDTKTTRTPLAPLIRGEPSRVAVLCSGGVDSSVVLALLKDAGYDVTAIYLKIWLEDEVQHLGDCGWEEDLDYLEKTCKLLDVPHRVLSMQRQYWDIVVQQMLDDVRRGATPNPDVWCNEKVKFGAVFEKIFPEFDFVATGHYAALEQKNDAMILRRAPDTIKDQTYFLYRLSQEQLQKTLFPLGAYTKEEVRTLAEQYDLPAKNRKDSQGICFLGKFRFRDFLLEHLGVQKGEIILEETGENLGEHDGFWYYTIGQRQGLRLSGGPYFVTKKDPKANTVFVSREKAGEYLCEHFTMTSPHWISGSAPKDGKYLVKLRHGPEMIACTLRGKEIILERGDAGIAEGQSAVLYDGEVCLGGGYME